MVNRTWILLIGGYASALLLGAYELNRPLSIPATEPDPAALTIPAVELPPDTIKDIAAFNAIVERPLFRRERRPETADASPVRNRLTRDRDDIDGMRLSAVLKGPQDITILIEDRNGETQILHEGDKLGRWQIKRILDDRVVVVSQGREKALLVHRFAPPETRMNATRPAQSPNQKNGTREAARRIAPRSSLTGQRADARQD